MDPDITLQLLREEFKKGNYLAAAIIFAALDGWLASGGFLPAEWEKR